MNNGVQVTNRGNLFPGYKTINAATAVSQIRSKMNVEDIPYYEALDEFSEDTIWAGSTAYDMQKWLTNKAEQNGVGGEDLEKIKALGSYMQTYN
jgi:hypothetical protein